LATKGGWSSAPIHIEAIGRNGVVLAADSMIYKMTDSPGDARVSGGLLYISPAEVAHLSKVRVGFGSH